MCGEFGYTLQEKKYAEFNLETGLRMVKIMELMSFIFELQLCKAIIERFEKKCSLIISGLQLSKFAIGEICRVLHVLKWLLLIYMYMEHCFPDRRSTCTGNFCIKLSSVFLCRSLLHAKKFY